MLFKSIFLSLRNIQKKRLRSALCIISVAIATFSVVFILNVGSLGKTAVNTELEKTGLGGLLLYCEGAGTIKNSSLEVIKQTKGIRDAAGVIMDKVTLKQDGEDELILWGIDSGVENLISLEAVQGRFFSKTDIEKKCAVCMVDENVAARLSETLQLEKPEDVIGKVLQLKIGARYYDFETVGIVKAGGGILQNFTSLLPSMIFIPQSTYTTLTGRSSFTQVAVKLDSRADSDLIKLQLTRKLSEVGSIKIENLAKQKDALTNVINIITLIVTAIGGISILVSGFGIMTMMLMTVSERTREIGIKKALGAKKRHIVSEFLFESVLIMALGFAVGCTIALVCVRYASAALGMNFDIPYGSIAVCFGATLLLGLLFGGYPAYKAASLLPANALSGE